MEEKIFKDLVVENPQRKKLKILQQSADEIIADISYAETVTESGTPINAEVMTTFQNCIVANENLVQEANTKAESAVEAAGNASSVAQSALSKAEEATTTANGATQTAVNAKSVAEEAMAQVTQGLGTKVYETRTDEMPLSNLYMEDVNSALENLNNSIVANSEQIDVVKDALTLKADLTNTEQIVSAKTVKADNLELNGAFSALKNIGGGFSISDATNVGIELGRRDGTAGTPYIDFHTDGQGNTDYNVRMIAASNALEMIASNGVKVNGYDVLTTQYTSSGNTEDLPSSSGQYREFVLGNANGDKKLVFYQEFTSSSKTTTFTGGAFDTILLIWIDQASTADTQTQRTTLSSFTNTSWTAYNAGYRHRVNIIGIK